MHAVGGGTRESSHVAVRDHFVESVLSSHVYVGSGDWSQATGLAQQMLSPAESHH